MAQDKSLSDLYDDFLKTNTRICDRVLADGFEQSRKAYEFLGIPFAPQTVEEYGHWLAVKYPIPVPDWMDVL